MGVGTSRSSFPEPNPEEEEASSFYYDVKKVGGDVETSTSSSFVFPPSSTALSRSIGQSPVARGGYPRSSSEDSLPTLGTAGTMSTTQSGDPRPDDSPTMQLRTPPSRRKSGTADTEDDGRDNDDDCYYSNYPGDGGHRPVATPPPTTMTTGGSGRPSPSVAVCWGWKLGSTLMASPAPAVSVVSEDSSGGTPDSAAAAAASAAGAGPATMTAAVRMSQDLSFPAWSHGPQHEQSHQLAAVVESEQGYQSQPQQQQRQHCPQQHDSQQPEAYVEEEQVQEAPEQGLIQLRQQQQQEDATASTSLVQSLCDLGEAACGACAPVSEVAELGAEALGVTQAVAEAANLAGMSFDSLTAGFQGMMAAGEDGQQQEQEGHGDDNDWQHQQQQQQQRRQDIDGGNDDDVRVNQVRDFYLAGPQHQQEEQQQQQQQHYLTAERDCLMEQAAQHEEAGDLTSALLCLERCLATTTGVGPQGEELSSSSSPPPQPYPTADLSAAPAEFADVLHKIGVLHWKGGSYDEALRFLKDSLSIYRRTLTVVRADTYVERDEGTGLDLRRNDGADALSEILNSVGRVYLSRGEYGAALRYYQESLAMQTSVYADPADLEEAAPRRPQSVVSSGGDETAEETDDRSSRTLTEGSGFQWFSGADVADADAATRKKNKKKRRRAAIDHPGVARTIICMGMIHEARGKYARAMRYYQDGLRAQRSSLGNEHVDTAATLNSIGAVHEKCGDHGRAMECYREALWIYRTRLGDDHVDVAVTLNNTGQVHHHWGQYDEAMASYLEALRVMKMVLGTDHRNVAATLHNIALVHSVRGQYDKALKIYRDVLKSQRAALGDSHCDVAVTLDSIASAYEGRGRYDKALKFYSKALRVRRSALGREHLFVAMTLDRLGRFHMERDRDYDEAVRRLEEAREIYASNLLGDDDPRVLEVMRNLEAAVGMRGRH